MSTVEVPVRPGSDRGRGDGDRQPGAPQVAVVPSWRNLGRLDLEPDDAAINEQPRDRLLDRVVNHSLTLLRGARKAATFVAILLGAAMLIKFMTLADETVAARHSPVLVHGNELLSTLRAVCDSHACQRYAWELQASLDVSRHPCRSLYDFVCGRWRRGAAVPSVREMAEARLLKEALNTVLASNTTPSVSPDTVSDRVAGLVSSCLRAKRDPNELRAFLRKRGVLNHQWRSSPHAVLSTLVDLSLNWDIHVWFQLRIDSYENKSTTVFIGRSNSLHKWADVFRKTGKTKKYKAGVERAFRILGLLDEEVATDMVQKESMDALVSALLKSSEVVPERGPLDSHLATMAERLTPAVSAKAWVDALRATVPPAVNISEKTFVRVESTRVLHTLNSLLEFGSRRQNDVAGYIAYRVFVEIGWMVDGSNSTVRDRPLHFMPARMTNRCLREVERMTGLAWFSLLTAPHVEGHFTREPLALILPDWASSTSIGGPADASVDLGDLPTPRPSFFAEWLAFKEAKRELTSSGLYDILRIGGVQGGFWHRERNLTVEPLVFSYPFFHSQLHPVLNYGGAGRLIARALLGLVSPNTSAKATEEMAVSMALRALRDTLGSHVNAFTNSAAVDQLFFMASCYAVCDAEDAAGTARHMCDAPVMKLRAYRTAFGCSSPLGKKSRTAHKMFIDFGH
ncbi:hypothetical protein HPB49_009086 [Dermacentor silvarum]|uniref:Uncharacterized protein n=1 Tax=Dermacentor silvarum TaxID=543639 RepID=A0ACB8D3K9_DERSI|nr:hypothetical protein HPB49_009086 [Dermacentor silvarum]